MKVRALNDRHDWVFGKGLQGYKQNREAVKQRIKTHLLSFYYDCFFDLEFGIDWKNFWGSKNKKNEIIISCRKQILLIDEVTSCQNIDAVIDDDRDIRLSYTVTDKYGLSFSDTLQLNMGQL